MHNIRRTKILFGLTIFIALFSEQAVAQNKKDSAIIIKKEITQSYSKKSDIKLLNDFDKNFDEIYADTLNCNKNTFNTQNEKKNVKNKSPRCKNLLDKYKKK